MPNEITQFYSEVVEKLETYVYRSIVPRSGETFYIGNGKGSRVFAYVGGELVEDGPSNAFLRLPIAKWTPFVTTGLPTGDPVTPLP